MPGWRRRPTGQAQQAPLPSLLASAGFLQFADDQFALHAEHGSADPFGNYFDYHSNLVGRPLSSCSSTFVCPAAWMDEFPGLESWAPCSRTRVTPSGRQAGGRLFQERSLEVRTCARKKQFPGPYKICHKTVGTDLNSNRFWYDILRPI